MLKFHREGPATNGATLSFLFRYIYLKLEFFIYIYDLQDAMETHASQIKGLLFFITMQETIIIVFSGNLQKKK